MGRLEPPTPPLATLLVLSKSKKLTGVYYSLYGKHEALLYGYRSSQFIKPEKITAKFAVQICDSKKSFAVAEVQKNYRKLIANLADLRLRTTRCYFTEFTVVE